MAHPKRRQSSQRQAKRRTHYKATVATFNTDPTTGESHLRHRAHWTEGKLYYRGKIVVDNVSPEEGSKQS